MCYVKKRRFCKTFNFDEECQQDKNPSLLLSKKPVSSEEKTWKGHFLGGKEHAIEEDGEVGAS
eukprot:8228257-Ditylum_brightwellii.AAC.1